MAGPEAQEMRKRLTELFAGYRAEWLNEEVFEYFTQPSYFPQLVTPYPCFLVGGRGSGKTTVLRCLSYEGQFAMAKKRRNAVTGWDYFGFYYRVNTNRVAAFEGPELDDTQWARLFGHYINLELCEKVFRFLNWYAALFPDAQKLDAKMLAPFAASMGYEEPLDQAAMAEQLELSRLRFESLVNSIGDRSDSVHLTMQGAPVDALMRSVRSLPQFNGRHFFFLIDEYENLTDMQQRVCNTLIKHCGDLYSFKVGVRELGLRQRSTLNKHEQLTHPADYKRIDITEELDGRFVDFAERVLRQRLRGLFARTGESVSLDEIFPALTAEQEAAELGVGPLADNVRNALVRPDVSATSPASWATSLPDMELFTLSCRAEAENVPLEQKVKEAFADQKKWSSQYENYRYAYLFVIRRYKRGIRKYYAGWKTYCALAANNLRFLFELVDQALTRHLEAEGPEHPWPVSARVQTEAAQSTGQKNLRELEGLTIHGARLTRLLLGLGRVFQVMAEDPIGHTPEVNQFNVDMGEAGLTQKESEQLDILLKAAVMHLAVLRYPGSKLQEQSDIKQHDFTVHPIYAPFFGFSYRRKRKISLSPQEVLALAKDTSAAVKTILDKQNRTEPDELPDQLRLFEGVYAP